jgi:hypothetical protein
MGIFEDYLRFHELAVKTRDVDPVYPVLRKMFDRLNLYPSSDEALWLSVCHLTWYDFGSALKAWELSNQRIPGSKSQIEALVEAKLPCATERRGNRDPKQLFNNLESWSRESRGSGGLFDFLTSPLDFNDGGKSWYGLRSQVELVKGNGRWAGYKAAELFQKANGLPVVPQDMGHANSTGPRHGLELLIDELPQDSAPETVRLLDRISVELVSGLEARGLPALVEEAETTLCDFHALFVGRYYVGHDIDQMLGQIDRTTSAFVGEALAARYETLPYDYLGEHHDWDGIDDARRKVYRDTGQIVTR